MRDGSRSGCQDSAELICEGWQGDWEALTWRAMKKTFFSWVRSKNSSSEFCRKNNQQTSWSVGPEAYKLRCRGKWKSRFLEVNRQRSFCDMKVSLIKISSSRIEMLNFDEIAPSKFDSSADFIFIKTKRNKESQKSAFTLQVACLAFSFDD